MNFLEMIFWHRFSGDQKSREQGCEDSRYKGDRVGFCFQISTRLCAAGKEPWEREKIERQIEDGSEQAPGPNDSLLSRKYESKGGKRD